jgi:hypothetical protein
MVKNFELRYQVNESWPRLSWLAECHQDSNQITIHCGPAVERRVHWFCEAVWDDSFETGDFDLTSQVFGSGGRLRDGEITFVSSSFSSDRLQSFHRGNVSYVSNSLACLCAFIDLSIDPWYPWYYEDINSIVEGIDGYKKNLETNRDNVSFTYFHNLTWNGHALMETAKPSKYCPFNDFTSYYQFLADTLEKFAHNLRSAGRSRTLGTISTSSAGYDSLSVTLLAREIGNSDVICVPTSRTGYHDNAIEIISQLDLKPIALSREEWRKKKFGEIPFIAADACGRDTWIAGAESKLRDKLLLTGYFGDGAWAVPACRSSSKGSISAAPGLSMSEHRLIIGYQHCPVPALGIEYIDTIHDISTGDEMKPWTLGLHYDRPIPRRILESAGINRDKFARLKSAITIQLFRKAEFEHFMPGSASFIDYMKWIRKQSTLQPPVDDTVELGVTPRENVEVPLFRHMFPWALEKLKKHYCEHDRPVFDIVDK